jgi:uncharacterized protein (DUF952 family)
MMIFKIYTRTDWLAAMGGLSHAGSADDIRDGFIHLSTGDQLPGTLERHYKGRDGLVLVAVAADALGPALRWEPSRGGGLFPHLYGPLPVAAAGQTWGLELGADGRHVLPELTGLQDGPAC